MAAAQGRVVGHVVTSAESGYSFPQSIEGRADMFKAIFYQLLRIVPDWRPFNYLFAQARYFARFRHFLMPYRPRTFNDFLLRRKLSPEAASPLRCRVTDKYELKNFVEERLGHGFTPRTFAVLENPEEIARDQFPVPCVVKPTHSSGQVLFVDHGQPDARQRREIARWLKVDYFVKGREPNYKQLRPRIIVEESLKTGGEAPCDLKVFCFHGRPQFIQVDFDRFERHQRTFYGMDGERLPMKLTFPVRDVRFPFPDLLDEIRKISAALSSDFEFVRVDLYAVRKALCVGELTFFPGNCLEEFEPTEFRYELGRMFSG